MRDMGIVCMKNGVLGVSATFKKRYITLAPIAGVVGLAFNLKDPENLLQGKGSEGITIALLKRGHRGMTLILTLSTIHSHSHTHIRIRTRNLTKPLPLPLPLPVPSRHAHWRST